MEKITPKQILELIRKLPDSESHIHVFQSEFCVTTEWLVGNFAGRGFGSYTSFEDSAQQLIDYLYSHIGHESMVGRIVTERLAVIVKTDKGDFVKHYLGLSDNVTYFSEQLIPSKVSTKHYKVIFKPSVIVPDVDLK